MAIKQHPARSLREIFSLAKDIGSANVQLNDSEFSIVVYGEQAPKAVTTIAKERSEGTLDVPFIRGRYGQALYSLDAAIEYRESLLRRRA